MKNRSTKLSIQRLNKSFLIRIFAIVFLFAGIASATIFYIAETKRTNAATNPYGDCTIEYFSSNHNASVNMTDGATSCTIGVTIPQDAGYVKSDIRSISFPASFLFPKTFYAPDSIYLFSSDGSGNPPSDTYWTNLQEFVLDTYATFDTSNMTTMLGMFQNASSLTSSGIDNLISNSGFKTDSVTDMRVMFANASSITELDLSNFNTSNVTKMDLMFAGMNNLETLTLGSNFTTNNVAYMDGMFATYYDFANNQTVEDKFSTLILKAPFTFKGNTYLNGTWCRNGSTTDCYSDFSSGTTLPTGTYTKQNSTPDPDPEDTVIAIPGSATASKYDGTTKTAPNYDSTTMQWQDDPMCDSIYQINAYDYASCVVPKTGYVWSDGTKTSQYLYWTIPKGDPQTPSSLPSGLTGTVGEEFGTVELPSGWYWSNGTTDWGYGQRIQSGTNNSYAFYNPDPANYEYNQILISFTGVTEDPQKPTNLSANNLTYNGVEQTVTINNFNSNTMNVSGDKGTNAGDYTAYVTSKTGQWADGTSDAVEVSWQIQKATPSSPTLPQNLEGREGSLLSTVSPGSNYRWENDGQQISFGRNSYSAKYNPDSNNYNDLSVSIYVSGFRYQTKPSLSQTSFQYDGNSHTPTINNSFGCTGQTSGTNKGQYTITCTLPEYYKWTDGSISNVVLNWSITPKSLTKPTLNGTNYTGNKINILEDEGLLIGYDPETMYISGTTEATDVGLYYVTITIRDRTNYQWSNGSTDDIELLWHIDKKPADKGPYEEAAETPIRGSTGNAVSALSDNLPDGCEWKTPNEIIAHGENKKIALCGEDNNHSAVEIEFTVIGMTHIDAPTPIEGLVYNGNYQSGLNGFDSTKMEVVEGSDAPSQRDAKSYRTVLRPKTYYMWFVNDGEFYPNENERWVDWSIAKKESDAEKFPTDKLSGDVGDKLEDIVPYNGCSWENKTETVKSGENLYSAICYENNDKDNFEPITIKISIVGTEQPIKPTVASSLYYNGKEQTGIIGFNSSTMELVSGTIKATKAGTYSVEIKSKTGKWSDKSTANFKANWEIKKRVAPTNHPSEYPSQKENDDDPKNVYKTATVGDKLKTIDPPTTDAFKCYWKNPEELIKKGKNAYVAVCAEDGDFENNESFEMNVYIFGIEKDKDEDGSDSPNTGIFGSDSSFAKAMTSALVVLPFVTLAIFMHVKNRRPKIDFKKRN